MRDQLAAPLELGGDGDRVGRLAAAVEVDDRVVDDLVGGPVEVDAAHDLGDVGDGVLGQQHRAEHALLGGVVLRRRAVAGPGRALARLVGRRAVAPVVHRSRSGEARAGPARRCSRGLRAWRVRRSVTGVTVGRSHRHAPPGSADGAAGQELDRRRSPGDRTPRGPAEARYPQAASQPGDNRPRAVDDPPTTCAPTWGDAVHRPCPGRRRNSSLTCANVRPRVCTENLGLISSVHLLAIWDSLAASRQSSDRLSEPNFHPFVHRTWGWLAQASPGASD